jgi:replicative superfamily II helicase
MANQDLDATLREYAIPTYVERATDAALGRGIAAVSSPDLEQPHPERLPRLGFLFESQGLAAYQKWVSSSDLDELQRARSDFSSAFACWRALAALGIGAVGFGSADQKGSSIDEIIHSELSGDPLPTKLNLAFRLAVSSVMSQCSAEGRLELMQFTMPPDDEPRSWRDRVAWYVCSAFVLFTRKSLGWTDIDKGLEIINNLRQLQKQYEETYLDAQGEAPVQTGAALELVGLYHLAQMVTLAGEYLRDGNSSIQQINNRIDRHIERGTAAFQAGARSLLSHLGGLLWAGCRELTQNAIWTHIVGLGESLRQFARVLTSRGRPVPVIELWPSQQEALRRNLMDPYKRAVLVQMPTSAGKTLLGKFLIIQTKALNPNGKIAYVVPTRALVNQITLDLRADFRGIDPAIRVEQAVPAFELDPAEEKLLQTSPDVLVTTPEKLDLLIRRNHPTTQDLALVIADEAHNISDEGRGPRLELLLGTIKRDRAGARFLLLSPFLPNDDELVRWLGEDRSLAISVSWKPGRKLVGAVELTRAGSQRTVVLKTLRAAANTDVREGMEIPILRDDANSVSKTISSLTLATIRAMLDRGSILVLCRGQGTAVARAQEVAELLPELPVSREADAVCRYLEAEVGYKPSIVELLRRGVAYHHAGLSHEARWLVELLIRRSQVKVVCGTTTLAQGINFPICTVIVETLKKGKADLTYQDFWNIAGRAGRTLVDALGIVVFPTRGKTDRDEHSRFLKGEAEQISSQLATLISDADRIAAKFDLKTVREWPQLSPLLQFLAHAMRLAGGGDIAAEVEDLLRASLVYHQARREGGMAAQRLADLCRRYLQHIQGNKGILTLADQTGFATPSVLSLLAQTKDNAELKDPRNWLPGRLFGDDLEPLTRRVEAIATLPEIKLGQEEHPPFNPKLVAAILRSWVRGDTLMSMADQYWRKTEGSADERVSEFSRYLFSQLIGRASWGLGALESVSLATAGEADVADAAYIPSMVFFGVRQPEAIWLRMVGVPRVVADNLATLWRARSVGEPGTYDKIRGWVNGLTESDWRQAIPPGAPVTPQDMRLIWEEFAG